MSSFNRINPVVVGTLQKMIKYWILFVLLIPIATAWKSSTEDQRTPSEYHKDLQEERDLIEYQNHDSLHRKRLSSRNHKESIETQNPITKTKLNKETDIRKRAKVYRRDATEYRNNFSDRNSPTGYRREPRELRRVHYHTKRHMLADTEPKKRSTTLKPIREIRKKPSGHLTPLEDDDMDNDEVVSVAIGPPPLRGKFEKPKKKQTPKPSISSPSSSAVELVKNLFSQMTKDFLSRDVDENFVFGQYLGNSMKNLTSDLRLTMQHEILELIVKYQKANRGEVKADNEKPPMIQILKDGKIEKKINSANDTEEWPDFSNLEKIVG